MNKRKHDENTDNSQITKRAKILEDILSEDGTVKFDFMTSLQKITIAKIISNLWMNQNTQQEIKNLFHSDRCPEIIGFKVKWQNIENNVVAKVSELCLDNSISNMLKNIVPVFGSLIIDWIEYHDKYTFNTLNNSNYSAADLISHITWTARGRIDLAKTAKNILSSESCLSDDHKYKLACTYCLEDEIAVLAPKVVSQCYLDSIDIHIHPMVYFWKGYVTGDYKEIYNHCHDCIYCSIDNISIYNYIMQFLMLHQSEGNDISIAYMWKKLNEQDKAENDIVTLIEALLKKDWRYSLLSNLDYQQQQKVFKECSTSILVDLLNDWLWEEYFSPVVLHILDIIYPQTYSRILYEIIRKMNKCYCENVLIYHQHKSFLKKLWQDGSGRFKDFIFNYNNGKDLILSLSWERDLDIIDLIFKDINNAKVKKNVIFSEDGIDKCSELIKNDEWHLLELLMKYTLSSKKDISKLKEILIRDKGSEIAFNYLNKEEFDKIEHFMKWAFKSDEEIVNFRQSLVFDRTVESVIGNIFENKKVDFMKLENHFKWCAKDDLQLISQFKTEILKSDLGERLIHDLIKSDQYELLEQWLNWCYLDNQHEIAQYKCNIYKMFTVDFFSSLIEKDNSLKMLDKFIDYSFTNEQQLQEFKMWILHSQKELFYEDKSVCAELLKKYQFQLADELINWCGISSETVGAFKNASMLSGDILVVENYAYWDTKNLQLLIKWFNPSENTIKKLKAISKDKFKKHFFTKKVLNNFLKLLDEFTKNRNLLIVDSEGNVSKDLEDCHDDMQK